MIVYIATWPRCGNAFVRNLIYLNYRVITADGYPSKAPWPERLNAEYFSDFIKYQDEGQPPRLALQHGALDILNDKPDLRRELAAMSETFLVKTHEMPPEDPVDGEAFVCMVRHPVRAVASRRKLLVTKDVMKTARGDYIGGHWSDFHRLWHDSPMPRVSVRYEDVVGKPEVVVRPCAELLGLPELEVVRDLPIAASKALNPERNPGLGNDGWKTVITDDEAAAIWEETGEAASAWGYEPVHEGAQSEQNTTA